jgi:hypothetical protein
MTTTPAYKICLLGDYGTGKSRLFNLFSKESFQDSFVKNIQTNTAHVQLWDVDEIEQIPDSYYKNAAAYILMFDTFNKNSFYNINHWWHEITAYHCDNMSSIAIIVIGTRRSSISCKTRPVICTGYGQDWADAHACSYSEIDLDSFMIPDILDRITTVLGKHESVIQVQIQRKEPVQLGYIQYIMQFLLSFYSKIHS